MKRWKKDGNGITSRKGEMNRARVGYWTVLREPFLHQSTRPTVVQRFTTPSGRQKLWWKTQYSSQINDQVCDKVLLLGWKRQWDAILICLWLTQVKWVWFCGTLALWWCVRTLVMSAIWCSFWVKNVIERLPWCALDKSSEHTIYFFTLFILSTKRWVVLILYYKYHKVGNPTSSSPTPSSYAFFVNCIAISFPSWMYMTMQSWRNPIVSPSTPQNVL